MEPLVTSPRYFAASAWYAAGCDDCSACHRFRRVDTLDVGFLPSNLWRRSFAVRSIDPAKAQTACFQTSCAALSECVGCAGIWHGAW